MTADQPVSDVENVLAEFAFDVTEKYDLPFTNNEPRVQDGQRLRHIGDFVRDLQEFLEPLFREREAKALEDAAGAVAAALMSEVGSGHTSTYAVRRWLRDRAAERRKDT